MIDQFPPTNTLPRMYAAPEDTREADPLAWQKDASCAQVGGDVFFPEKGESTRARDAKKVCASCPVRELCLEYALTHGERWGVWGGLSERERRKLLEKSGIGHGTNAMYNRGCHNENNCPRNDKGVSCSGAHRQYQAAWKRHHGDAA